MGACCSKNSSTTALTPTPQQADLQQPHDSQNDQQPFKKEIFVIKHRVSHEIDRHSDQDIEENPSSNGAGPRVRSSSCSKEEVDAILLQCGRLSRSNSTGAQNPNRRRRYSRSKRSFDFDLNARLKNANDDLHDDDNVHPDDNALNHRHRHRHRHGVRVSSPCSSSRRSSSKDRDSHRRISISPSRRSESPLHGSNSTLAAGGGGGGGGGSGITKPAKMVSVPATRSSISNADAHQVEVKRIHVKRNVSPAKRTNLPENHSQSDTVEADQIHYRRKSLVEIDNNATRRNPRNTRKLSQDLDMKPKTPSYASLLLEDIHRFHQKNAVATASTAPPDFALPECVSKACSIMEAVADLNSSTSSLFSDEKWRNPMTMKKHSLIESGTGVNGVSAAIESRETSSVAQECEMNQLGRIQRDFGSCYTRLPPPRSFL